MSIKVVEYLFETSEFLCESYDRNDGKKEIIIPFCKVNVFADSGSILGICKFDSCYYFLSDLPSGVSSMIVESVCYAVSSGTRRLFTDNKCALRYKIEVTYDDGTIMTKYLSERDCGEKLETGDYLERHVDNKFYTDHKATYEAKNRIASKFALLHKKKDDAE